MNNPNSFARIQFATFAVLAIFAAPALAWDDSGHRTVAQIAYDTIKSEDAKTLAAVDAIISSDPRHRTLYESSKWPDVLKEEPPQPNAPVDPLWHFVDIPYDASADDVKKTIENDNQTVDPKSPNSANVVTAIRYYTARLKSLQSDNSPDAPQAKADALSWLIHLCGDIHQPLHCVTVFRALPGYNPKTQAEGHQDRGGNGLAITWPVKSWKKYQDNLHSFWDDQLDLDKALEDADVPATAEGIEKAHSKSDFVSELKLDDPANWAQESFFYHEKAYDTPYKQVPNATYQTWVKTTAEMRIALAGYRLAKMLENTLGQ